MATWTLLVPPTATPTGRVFYVAAMVPAVVCAGLEMSRVHGGVVTNYGADLFGTAWAYVILRFRRTDRFAWRWVASPVMVAGATFAVGTASELAQRIHLIAGTYDSVDILTYALALVACVAIERGFRPFVRDESEGRRAEDSRT